MVSLVFHPQVWLYYITIIIYIWVSIIDCVLSMYLAVFIQDTRYKIQDTRYFISDTKPRVYISLTNTIVRIVIVDFKFIKHFLVNVANFVTNVLRKIVSLKNIFKKIIPT